VGAVRAARKPRCHPRRRDQAHGLCLKGGGGGGGTASLEERPVTPRPLQPTGPRLVGPLVEPCEVHAWPRWPWEVEWARMAEQR